MKRRHAVLGVVAALALSAAGLAAAHGRPPGSRGKPSTLPPAWSHGGGHGQGHGNGPK